MSQHEQVAWLQLIVWEMLIALPLTGLVGMWVGIYVERWWRGPTK